MEPPFKRLRLSIFNQCQPLADADLDSARLANDLTLKSRFEAIFEKYSKDFSGVGDEVDIMTGEIVVNRGHIECMTAETDPGRIRYDNGINGRSLLHAMAVEEEADDTFPRPDDVLQSIETIAENVGLMGSSTTDDSDDSLFNTSKMLSISPSPADDTIQDFSEVLLDPYDSDNDSLFARGETYRSQSIDSLFQDILERSGAANTPSHEANFAEVRSPSATPVYGDEKILAKFGASVGRQVLELLDQRQDAHIEPAWKIPVRLEPHKFHQPATNVVSTSSVDVSPGQKRNQSLWRMPPLRAGTSSRCESEDPLQEGFSSDSAGELLEEGHLDGVETNADSHQKQLLSRAATTGDCPYCHGKYSNKSGIMAHWDRLIKRSKLEKLDENDPHDIELIKRSRSKVIRRSRLPRLTVFDFRTMVGLHEGAGYTFEQIAREKILRTRKAGPHLQDVYDKHRTVPEVRRSPEPVADWTTEEMETLLNLSQNSASTMATVQRGLRGRGELEIGDKLAEIWLAQLKAGQSRTCTVLESSPPPQRSDDGLAQIDPRLRYPFDEAAVSIKEESEDELFR